MTVYFRVSTSLEINMFLRIILPDYRSEGINPTYCMIKYFGEDKFIQTECGVMSDSNVSMYV